MYVKIAVIIMLVCQINSYGQTIYRTSEAKILSNKKSGESFSVAEIINKKYKSNSFVEEMTYDPTGMVEKKMSKDGLELHFIDEEGNGNFSFSRFEIFENYGLQLNENCIISIGDHFNYIIEQMPDLQGTILENPKRIFIREGVMHNNRLELTDISLVITFDQHNLVDRISEIQR